MSNDLLAQIRHAQVRAGEDAVMAHLGKTMGALMVEAPRTYVDEDGDEKRDRRRKDRTDDDPRIDHLFNGFDNLIADEASEYARGYMKAMRLEFGQLIASLVR